MSDGTERIEIDRSDLLIIRAAMKECFRMHSFGVVEDVAGETFTRVQKLLGENGPYGAPKSKSRGYAEETDIEGQF